MWGVTERPAILPKTKGSGIMVSDLVEEHGGQCGLDVHRDRDYILGAIVPMLELSIWSSVTDFTISDALEHSYIFVRIELRNNLVMNAEVLYYA